MHAKKMILHTDAEGRLIEPLALPPNATLEAIFLITSASPTEQPPTTPTTGEVARRLAAANVGAVFGDPLAWQRREREDRPLPMPNDNQ